MSDTLEPKFDDGAPDEFEVQVRRQRGEGVLVDVLFLVLGVEFEASAPGLWMAEMYGGTRFELAAVGQSEGVEWTLRVQRDRGHRLCENQEQCFGKYRSLPSYLRRVLGREGFEVSEPIPAFD